ncbi:MAG: diguanylate cyclase [Desulfatibacillum sp.]|nr:diguanylate cyclase [Desulfatibacillum sp.]
MRIIQELKQRIQELERQAEADKALYAEQLHLFAGIFENSIEGIIVTDARGAILMVNPGFTSISGYHAEEVIGKTPSILKSGRHDNAFYQAMWNTLQESGRWNGEIWNRNKAGQVYVEHLSLSVIEDSSGNITHYMGIFHDISDIKQREEEYKYRALHDPLTDLPNRQLLEDRLKQAMASAKRHGKNVALLFVDLDDFKIVNDTYGHQTGDLFLQEVARRLKACCRDEDTVSRNGGDEFLMILSDLSGTEADKLAGARRVVQAFEEPAFIDGLELKILASIGIAVYPESGDNVNDLISTADAAMYKAKRQSGTCFVFRD